MEKLTPIETVASRSTYGDNPENLNEHLKLAKGFFESYDKLHTLKDDYEFQIALAHLTYYLKMNE